MLGEDKAMKKYAVSIPMPHLYNDNMETLYKMAMIHDTVKCSQTEGSIIPTPDASKKLVDLFSLAFLQLFGMPEEEVHLQRFLTAVFIVSRAFDFDPILVLQPDRVRFDKEEKKILIPFRSCATLFRFTSIQSSCCGGIPPILKIDETETEEQFRDKMKKSHANLKEKLVAEFPTKQIIGTNDVGKKVPHHTNFISLKEAGDPELYKTSAVHLNAFVISILTEMGCLVAKSRSFSFPVHLVQPLMNKRTITDSDRISSSDNSGIMDGLFEGGHDVKTFGRDTMLVQPYVSRLAPGAKRKEGHEYCFSHPIFDDNLHRYQLHGKRSAEGAGAGCLTYERVKILFYRFFGFHMENSFSVDSTVKEPLRGILAYVHGFLPVFSALIEMCYEQSQEATTPLERYQKTMKTLLMYLIRTLEDDWASEKGRMNFPLKFHLSGLSSADCFLWIKIMTSLLSAGCHVGLADGIGRTASTIFAQLGTTPPHDENDLLHGSDKNRYRDTSKLRTEYIIANTFPVSFVVPVPDDTAIGHFTFPLSVNMQLRVVEQSKLEQKSKTNTVPRSVLDFVLDMLNSIKHSGQKWLLQMVEVDWQSDDNTMNPDVGLLQDQRVAKWVLDFAQENDDVLQISVAMQALQRRRKKSGEAVDGVGEYLSTFERRGVIPKTNKPLELLMAVAMTILSLAQAQAAEKIDLLKFAVSYSKFDKSPMLNECPNHCWTFHSRVSVVGDAVDIVLFWSEEEEEEETAYLVRCIGCLFQLLLRATTWIVLTNITII